MSEFNIEDLDAVIASAESSLVQMLALQLKGQIRKSEQLAAESVAIREQSEEVYAAGYNHGHLNTVDGIAYAGCVKDDFYSLALQVMAEVETPATDRIVAGIKADGRIEGINFAAGRLAAAFNHGFVDKSMAEVYDVVRMILTAKEDLANNPAEDGLSGEYAEKSLAEWEAALREGADK